MEVLDPFHKLASMRGPITYDDYHSFIGAPLELLDVREDYVSRHESQDVLDDFFEDAGVIDYTTAGPLYWGTWEQSGTTGGNSLVIIGEDLDSMFDGQIPAANVDLEDWLSDLIIINFHGQYSD